MVDIQTEIKRFLEDIREKTGVAVYCEERENTTVLPLEYCGVKKNVYFEGTEEEAKKVTPLLNYLLANADFKQLLPGREEYLKSILLGDGNKAYAYKFLTKYNYTDGACFALDILPEKRINEVLLHIEACLTEGNVLTVQMDDNRIAVVVFSGLLPALETGNFLNQSLYEELGVRARIGVGCEVKTFTDIATSYLQAATAVRMSGMFDSKGEVHAYREFLLVKMLEEIPKDKLKDYMEQFRILSAEEVLSDEEMANTAEVFLENSLNISETSRNLYMHRNTLMYRLDKIERITGLNIRNFSDAVTFRVITILNKLLKAY